MILRPKALRSMRTLVEKAEECAADETNENWPYLRGYADSARAFLDVLVAALNESQQIRI